jgi:histidyl-tRNA synthetase
MATKTKRTPVKAKPAAKKKKDMRPAPAVAAPAVPAPARAVSTPQVLRGMRDTLPSEQRYWRYIYKKIESLARAYGYERIDTPILEETGLFVRTAGKQTDVVEKEMFSFIDKGGDNVTLRPEGTAPVARAYINHGMFALPQPVKLYYVGPMFRYERPQHGRFRQHHQFGFEVFGDANPVLDAEVILLAHLFYKDIGVKTAVQINSLGCQTCRAGFLTELTTYYRTKRSGLCEDCKRRLAKNPLRLLDCKDPGCMAVKDAAPNIVDHLDEECKNHFMRVLEYLDDLQVPYSLNHHLVRGFDYYTRTVFEIVLAEETEGSSPSALGGGGRYDMLVEQIGGRPTPACGFGIGIERAILQMKAQQIEPVDDLRLEIFLAQLGDAARRKIFNLFEDLRAAGIAVSASFSKNSLKSQLEVANRLGAKYTVIIGQKEVLDGTILIRDMESGMQEIIDYNKAIADLKKKLGRA